MSDENAPQDTNQGAQDVSDDTLITTDQPEGDGEKKPEPIYKDQDEKPDADPEGDDKGDDKPQEKADEKKADSEDGDDAKGEGDSTEYESLEAPEDSLLTDADMERILEFSKQEGLSKEAAQKQVEFANDILRQNQENLEERHSELSEQWIKDCKADKEIGGEKFDDSLAFANKAIKKFASDEFIDSLNKTKFGNNPEVVKVFARIGKAMSSDELILSGPDSGGEKTYEEILYPETNQ